MKKKSFLLSIIILITALFVQCSKEEELNNVDRGKISLKMTDAPPDDANVRGTFITVSDVKIDGQPIDGFAKQTIDISAFNQGKTKLLVSDEVKTGLYNSVSIVLDYTSDVSSDSPGCYVLTENDEKHNLAEPSKKHTEIIFNKSFNVDKAAETSLVIDFDLRKSVVRDTDTITTSEYKFVTAAEMQNAVRIINENSAGEIHGKISGTTGVDHELYVFAYQKGEYDASLETRGQGSSKVFFANAVTSAKVQSDGSYKLSFLKEGDYEVHVASFISNNDSHSAFNTMVQVSSDITGLLLNDVSVSSGAEVELNMNILGII